jgi:creatinine amidohydrolase
MIQREIIYLRPEQVRAQIELCPLAYLPLGLVEWHGPHLPLGMDGLNAAEVARQSADLTGGLIFPTFYLGTERERPAEMLEWLGLPADRYVVGMDFPHNSLPSLYAYEEIFALLVREQIRLAQVWGFKLLVIVSGHAAENQLTVLERLAAEFNAGQALQVLAALPFVRNSSGVMEVGHASKVETSLMLALHPETVALERLPALPEPLRNADWAVIDYQTFLGDPTPARTVHPEDDPRLATAETGLQTIQLAVAQISQQVNLIKQKWNLK